MFYSYSINISLLVFLEKRPYNFMNSLSESWNIIFYALSFPINHIR